MELQTGKVLYTGSGHQASSSSSSSSKKVLNAELQLSRCLAFGG